MRTATSLPWLLAIPACVSPDPPPEVRWFAPSPPTVEELETPPHQPLTLAPVTAAGHLGVEFVWRLDDVEVLPDAGLRWSEDPARMLERALEAELFASGAFARQPRSREVPRLEVYLVAFECRVGTPRRATVVLDYLHTNGDAAREGRVRATADVPDGRPASAVRAVVRALHDAVRSLRGEVTGGDGDGT